MTSPGKATGLSCSGLAVVIHSLQGGGAERVAALLANHWAERGISLTLITLDRAERDAYPLDARVRRIALGLMSDSRGLREAVGSNLLRAIRLRRAIRESGANAVVSLTDKINVTTLLACRGLRVGVVICERTDPRRQEIGRIWSWLRRRVYPCCRSLVVQTESVRRWARSIVPGKPVYVIPNAAVPPRGCGEVPVAERGGERGRHRVVVLGRLSPEKGFDLLLAAFRQVAARHADWSAEIWGEGTARKPLEQLRSQLGLEARVALPGWTADPESALRQADLFVLPSRYEGFPNALLEAMACGLACISSDCPSGPAEIIRHGVDGLLVPPEDVGALARAMDQLMSDRGLRDRLGQRAREVVARFPRDLFFRRWDAAIQGLPEAEFAALAASNHHSV